MKIAVRMRDGDREEMRRRAARNGVRRACIGDVNDDICIIIIFYIIMRP